MSDISGLHHTNVRKEITIRSGLLPTDLSLHLSSSDGKREPATAELMVGPVSGKSSLLIKAEGTAESKKELFELFRGVIHKDALLWFVPAILIFIVLVGVVYRGITGWSSKNEDLFDKIVSSQDKFEMNKTLRNTEQYEMYYSFYVIIFGVIFVGLGAAALLASRMYTVSDVRNVGIIGRKAALLSTVQIRQDQVNKRDLKNEVKSKEKKFAIAEEKTRETQEKLSVTERELELNKQQLEETKRDQMHREKMYKEHVDQLASDKESLEDDLRHKEKSQATLENELRSQRERNRIEQDNLRQRIATERSRQDDIRNPAYHKSRDSKSSCLCM